jgi:hypothetical protein
MSTEFVVQIKKTWQHPFARGLCVESEAKADLTLFAVIDGSRKIPCAPKCFAASTTFSSAEKELSPPIPIAVSVNRRPYLRPSFPTPSSISLL